MVHRSATVDDIQTALNTPIVFAPDPDDRGWFRGAYNNSWIFMRLNDFPEENLYSVWLGHDQWWELDTTPTLWKLEPYVDGWPATARPDLDKGQFHD